MKRRQKMAFDAGLCVQLPLMPVWKFDVAPLRLSLAATNMIEARNKNSEGTQRQDSLHNKDIFAQ